MVETDRPPRGIPRTKLIEHYEDDLRHGPFQQYWEGRLVGEGQYVRGMREGKWVDYDYASGKITCVAHWREDRLDGPFEMRSYFGAKFDPFSVGGVPDTSPGERHQKFLFAKGRLIGANGQPAANRLLDQLESGVIDNPQIAHELTKLMPVSMEFVETPLKDVLAYLQDQYHLPFVLDTWRVADIDRPITLNLRGVDLCTGLTMLTAPENLAFEYRYGVLFLTTAARAQDRRDPTGVADIRPAADSALGRAWEEPCTVVSDEEPLDSVLQKLAQPLAIGFDLSALPRRGVEPTVPITKTLKGLPLRHTLALILNDLDLACAARGDDTLVIVASRDLEKTITLTPDSRP